ncbi:Methylated-DNA-(protein)-cysteine S-methyltransferase [mine drainage metagenome]|uniref:methylated-DNA--[protein]-cysteine S-methyltransferase n=2 Tax=mine drainage metagenome TaxID=410659 RepID=T1C1A3_9ZZZZ
MNHATPNFDTLCFDIMRTPVGPLRLIADDIGLRRICFEHDRHPRAEDGAGRHDAARLAAARTQLQQYFDGVRRDFDLPLHPLGTPFQLQVWNALRGIAHGTTISYAELAARIGNPAARRAVGAANGRNPLPIVVPCHRVIGRDGSLVGFGGGLEVKRTLLALEGNAAFALH